MTTRSRLASLVMVAGGALLVVVAVIRRQVPTCRIDASPGGQLTSAAVPSRVELRRLVSDALTRVPSLTQSRDGRRLQNGLRVLDAALASDDPQAACRAWRDAAEEFRQLPADPATAPERSSLALMLDLTAASLRQADR